MMRLRFLLRLLGVHLVLLLLFVGVGVLSHRVSSKSLGTNVDRSLATLEDEGLYPRIMNFKLLQFDNFTDSLMLNVAVSVDAGRPLQSLLLNHWHHSEDLALITRDTRAYVAGESNSLVQSSYGRYWHGYLLILRPLLIWFDLGQLRIINAIVLTGLLLAVLVGLGRIGGRMLGLCFAVSMGLVAFPIVPWSMQFSSVFHIMFVATLLLLGFHGWEWTSGRLACFFYGVGACTSFMDLLTAPLITLGCPLVVVLALRRGRHTGVTVLCPILAWGFGYGGMWATKWLLGELLTDQSFLVTVSEQVVLRTSTLYKGMEMTIPMTIRYVVAQLHARHLLLPVIVLPLGVLLVYLAAVRDWATVRRNFGYLVVAAMFPLWFIILRNHTIQHGWFTWRSLAVSVFSMLLFVSQTADRETLVDRWRQFGRPKGLT